VNASLPSNPEATRFYSEGLAKLRVWDDLGARDSLEKAIVADPNFALAHSALAKAWSDLGYDIKAKEEAKRAFDLSANLSREDRLLVEGQYRDTTNDWDKALKIYSTLFGFFPDNLEYGLRLAAAQAGSGKPQDALVTVEGLRKLPPPARDDPRIDFREAAIAVYYLGDNKRALAATAKAAEKSQAQGAKLLLAGALDLECGLYLDKPRQARNFCEQARSIYAAVGDRSDLAHIKYLIGAMLSNQGDLVGAKENLQEVLGFFREIGNRGQTWNSLMLLGFVLAAQGDLSRSKTMQEEALRISREINDKLLEAYSLADLGLILLSEGDLKAARKLNEQSLLLHRGTDNKVSIANQMTNLASALYAQGDLYGGKKMLDEAVPVLREPWKAAAAGGLSSLGDILSAQGDLVGARKAYEEALSLSKETDSELMAAEVSLALARLSTEEGDPTKAETLVRQALEEFRTSKDLDDEISGGAVLAHTLLVEGNPAGAQKELDAAKPLVAKSQNRGVRLKMAIVSAQIHAASGQPSEAGKALDAAVTEAKQSGFLGYQFEARLALGEIEMKAGQTAAGRDRLARLDKDARAKGFLLIARKAASARTGS